MEKSHLTGSVHGPTGTSPEEAWTAVDGEFQRPQEVWIAGLPTDLLDQPSGWHGKIRERVVGTSSSMGLRLRFVMSGDVAEMDLFALTGAVLETLPGEKDHLFLHTELMLGPEEGLYIAYDNRPPALVTQVFFANRHTVPTTVLQSSPGALHLNIVLHDSDVGLGEIWNDGTLEYVLGRLASVSETPPERKNIHQLTLARSDSESHGISVGLERVRQEDGSAGGHTAADAGSRSSDTVMRGTL